MSDNTMTAETAAMLIACAAIESTNMDGLERISLKWINEAIRNAEQVARHEENEACALAIEAMNYAYAERLAGLGFLGDEICNRMKE